MKDLDRARFGVLDARLASLAAEVAALRETLHQFLATGEEEPVFVSQGLAGIETVERLYIEFVLARVSGNKTKAAEILGLDASTLHRKLTRWSTPGETRVVES